MIRFVRTLRAAPSVEITMSDPKFATALYPNVTLACDGLNRPYPGELFEIFPRLAKKIDSLWGDSEAIVYINQLLLPERGERHGFSVKVLDELTTLKQIHTFRYPDASLSAHDPFALPTLDIAENEATLIENTDQTAVTQPSGRMRSKWKEVTNAHDLRVILDERMKGQVSPPHDQRNLGEILLGNGLISASSLEAALEIFRHQTSARRQPLGHFLVQIGAVDNENVTKAICTQLGIPIVDLSAFSVPGEIFNLVPEKFARLHLAVPVAAVGDILFLAVDDPLQFKEKAYFSFLTNHTIELVHCAKNKLVQCLNHYGQMKGSDGAEMAFQKLAEQALTRNGGDRSPTDRGQDEESSNPVYSDGDVTIIDLVNRIIEDAANFQASDIHIETFPSSQAGPSLTRIRLRRDGRLEHYSELPSRSYHDAIVSRIKIMADLDITERRKAQDGKISFVRPTRSKMELRVSTIPTLKGKEDVTIRLLPEGEPLALDQIGLNPTALTRLKEVLTHPYGLILVCGPTGSGKTTTLHSVLRELNSPERKIWTAEDPIEIVQKDICQVQVNPRIGWTFASALRSFLRADPDVIMIGEMRDHETASIAIEASMTGHLVLSTLHTNSACETAARLLDLGTDPFNLSDAILAILAQRLARRLCTNCGEQRALSTDEVRGYACEYHFSAHNNEPTEAECDTIIAAWQKRFGVDGRLYVLASPGCDSCGGTGYRGRVGLHELLIATPDLRKLIRERASALDFLHAALAGGMQTLKQDGIEKVLQQLTDIKQVRSVCV
jgi:type II secretory ATPase GspE/PulE/Tfp pilus assembly ATPase PilB-like protein